MDWNKTNLLAYGSGDWKSKNGFHRLKSRCCQGYIPSEENHVSAFSPSRGRLHSLVHGPTSLPPLFLPSHPLLWCWPSFLPLVITCGQPGYSSMISQSQYSYFNYSCKAPLFSQCSITYSQTPRIRTWTSLVAIILSATPTSWMDFFGNYFFE